MSETENRRAFLTIAGAGLVLAACRKQERATSEPEARGASAAPSASASSREKDDEKQGEEPEVSATEDLMREHGVIRRVLVVYREVALRLRSKPSPAPFEELRKAAQLMRSFAEDYHEKQLEEAHLFPELKKRGGALGATVDTLIAQHQRGRELTDFIIERTQQPFAAKESQRLVTALEGFARMYEAHAALEDTLVFPAWKKTLSRKQLAEEGERFEDIEHRVFGKDGFADAVEQIAAIEKALGLELAVLTAPAVH